MANDIWSFERTEISVLQGTPTGRITYMSQLDPLPRPDEELPLEQDSTLLNEHDAELNYANALLWVSLTKATSSHEPTKEYVNQGERQCSEIIQARGRELKTAFEHFNERSSTKKND